MFNNEAEFQARLIKDLEDRGIDVIVLSGTLDLFVEVSHMFVELKIVRKGVKGYPSEVKGITFTKGETSAMRKLKLKPIVLACDGNDFYFFTPEIIEEKLERRKQFPRMITTEPHFPEKMSYETMLDKLTAMLHE